jgi:histidine triad (HIT) family protein
MTSCIFCKISKGEVPADVVYQDADVVVFTDAHPIAPVHLLLIPRGHVQDINGLTTKDEPLYGKIVRIASELAAKRNITSGWQLFVRVGKGGGQEVPHVHFHLVSGQHC